MHYYHCKHCIGLGIDQTQLQVPAVFSTLTVGKRSAPPGAKPSKRAKCLAIEN